MSKQCRQAGHSAIMQGDDRGYLVGLSKVQGGEWPQVSDSLSGPSVHGVGDGPNHEAEGGRAKNAWRKIWAVGSSCISAFFPPSGEDPVGCVGCLCASSFLCGAGLWRANDGLLRSFAVWAAGALSSRLRARTSRRVTFLPCSPRGSARSFSTITSAADHHRARSHSRIVYRVAYAPPIPIHTAPSWQLRLPDERVQRRSASEYSVRLSISIRPARPESRKSMSLTML